MNDTIDTAIILAGGKGERISKDFPSTPKLLLKVNDKTILELILDSLKETTITKVIITISHLANEIEEFIQSNHFNSKIELMTMREREALGTGGSIKNAMLNSQTEVALVLNGDTIDNFDFSNFIEQHIQNKNENSIGVIPISPKYSDFGSLEIENNHIKAFKEKSDKGTHINTGRYIFCDQAFNHTHKFKFSLEEEILPLLKYDELMPIELKGQFWDIGTKDRLEFANKDFL